MGYNFFRTRIRIGALPRWPGSRGLVRIFLFFWNLGWCGVRGCGWELSGASLRCCGLLRPGGWLFLLLSFSPFQLISVSMRYIFKFNKFQLVKLKK